MNLTICVTTYNRWELCLRALKSLCVQKDDQTEIILVDDCSSEPMPGYLFDFLESEKIVFIKHKVNKGLAAARNTAIKAASGEYFSFCDDDDQWPIGLLRRLFEAVQSGQEEVNMAIILPLYFKKQYENIIGKHTNLNELIRLGITPPVGSQIYKTETIRKVGGYKQEVRSGVDHDLWISLSRLNPRVSVVWGGGAITCSDPARERITMNEKSRRRGVEISLRVWEPIITEVFGRDFFYHFCVSYKRYLDYSFFRKSIRSGRFINATIRALNPNVSSVIIEKIFNKILGTPHSSFFKKHRNHMKY